MAFSPGSVSKGIEYWMVTTVDDKGNKALTGGMMKGQWQDNRELQSILT